MNYHELTTNVSLIQNDLYVVICAKKLQSVNAVLKWAKIGHFGDLGVKKMFTKKCKLEEKKVFFQRKMTSER